MSRFFLLAVIVLSLSGMVSAQTKKAAPDPHQAFKHRGVEYGVPMFNKIPFLSRYFTCTSVTEEGYCWDFSGTNIGVVSPDGRFFLTGTQNGQISLWNLHEPEKSRQNYLSIKNLESSWGGIRREVILCRITDLAFTQDGSRFVVKVVKDYEFQNHEIRLYETETGNRLRSIEFPEQTSIHQYALSPCGRYLACFGLEQNSLFFFRVYDLESKTTILNRQPPMVEMKPRILVNGQIVEGPYQICADSVQSMSFSPDSQTLLLTMRESGTELWNAQTGEVITRFADKGAGGILNGFSPDGTRIFVAGNDDFIGKKRLASAFLSVWDAKTGQLIQNWTPDFPGTTTFVSVAFTPDGKQILAAHCRSSREEKEESVNKTTTLRQVCVISEYDIIQGTLLASRQHESFGGELPLVKKYQPLYNNNVRSNLEHSHFVETMGLDFDLTQAEVEKMKTR